MRETANPTSSENQLFVERDGKKLAVVAFSDLDGTAFDETRPEYEALQTIVPAKDAFQELEKRGIPVGIITGRSLGEALHFQQALEGNGPIICEDGAVIVLPNFVSSAAALGNFQTVQLDNQTAVILSTVDIDKIAACIDAIKQQAQTANPADQQLVTSLDTPELIRSRTTHPNLEAAALSARRLASAYAILPTPTQLRIIKSEVGNPGNVWRIRTFSDRFPHFIGVDADKTRALRSFLTQPQAFFPHAGIDGVYPIFFGNNTNDLSLFGSLKDLGGIGVIVGHPQGGYFVDEQQIPPDIIKVSQPYGYGIQEALPRIFQMLDIT